MKKLCMLTVVLCTMQIVGGGYREYPPCLRYVYLPYGNLGEDRPQIQAILKTFSEEDQNAAIDAIELGLGSLNYPELSAYLQGLKDASTEM